MPKVYLGINNCNEYYTNHYFSSIFEDNASSTISAWRDAAKASESIKTPWSCLKENGKSYYTLHDKYLRQRSSYQILPIIKELAEKYIESLGYGNSNPFNVEINDIKYPIFKEIKKTNGNPLLWIFLVSNTDDNESVLDGNVFDGSFDDDSFGAFINYDCSAENIATKALFSNDVPPRWIILIGINGIALIDRNKWNEKRYLHFDLKEIFSRREESTFQAMSVLLHKDSLCPEDGGSLLDELDENSNKNAAEVSVDLKYALRECIELLGNEVLYDLKNNKNRDLDTNPVDASDLTMQCLRYMYRMLFVLFIESRNELGYAPMKDIAYATGYSLETLRDVVDNINEDTEEVGNGYYLGDSINKLFENIYYGYPREQEKLLEAEKMESMHDAFIIEPLKAHIFDPDLTPHITNAKLRNVTMIRIIKLMSISRENKHGKGRISYSNLGINQLGSVYEALLSYRGFIAEHTLYEVKRAGDKFDELDVGYFVSENEVSNYSEDERVRYEFGPDRGKLRRYEKGTFIYRLAGREREKSASYYTPEVLTKCLVKYSLKELLKDKTADQILSLTICEPAMGSAAFLNEAINQLAEAYITKKQEELGDSIPYEERYQKVQEVKMYIADKNIYGVDLNPTAVELAEVSLWLNTICKGGHIPWFGTQIVNGNSLIGARKQVYTKSQLSTDNSRLQWYNNAPERVMPGTKRNDKNQIYHFLVGDPGMCSYNDSVIKSLAKEKINLMKKWNKEFVQEYNVDDIESLLRLSSIIDVLWEKQISLRKEVEKKTSDRISIYGHEDNSEESHTTIRQKDYILKSMYKTEAAENAGPYARLKFAMDYWCSLWFWPIEKADLLPSRSEYIYDMSLILEGGIMAVKSSGYQGKHDKYGQYQYSLFDFDDLSGIAGELQSKYSELGKVNLDELCEKEERLALVRQISQDNHFMHWELEFADLFEERHGFDLMVGNPPWIKLTWNEQNLLSEKNPWFAVKKMSASETMNLRNDTLSNSSILAAYFGEYVFISGEQNYLNAITNYPSLKGQQTNLYKCFLPQAFYHISENGVSSFLMPEGIFDDPEAGPLRETIYPRLRKHFRFSNAKKLFIDVHTSREFGLNVYGKKADTISFDNIAYVYTPSTLEECYNSPLTKKVISLRNDNNEKNTIGAANRILKITDIELELFANIFGYNKFTTKLMVLFCKEQLAILKKIYNNTKLLGSQSDLFTTQFLDETNSQKNGVTIRNVSFPNDISNLVLSGSTIGVANIFYRTPRRICKVNNDYDAIDLNGITENYLPRSTYKIASYELLNTKIPRVSWDNSPVTNHPRILCRKLIDCDGERTLIPVLAPQKVLHINAIFSLVFKNDKQCILELGGFSSLIFDFLVKIQGKGTLLNDNTMNLPLLKNNNLSNELKNRVLLLNCISNCYSNVWQNNFDETMNRMVFSKNDLRLIFDFQSLSKTWTIDSYIKTDFQRRQLLLEIDVIVSLILGLSFEDLCLVYNSQFPILKSHEDNTWYDSKGRIIFTNNHSLIGVGVDREIWESIKNMKEGSYFKRYSDDTMPDGPIERTIEYVAPFDKCDRIEDYKRAWEFFSNKYGRSE